MGRPREEEEPRPPRRRRAPERDQSAKTLQAYRNWTPWFWLWCGNPECGRSVPIAVVPLIIRWGPNASIEKLKRAALCAVCGHKGATIGGRSWVDPKIGFQPWPIPGELNAAAIAFRLSNGLPIPSVVEAKEP